MEGVRVFSPNDWDVSGMDATSYAAKDLKECLEGLARHLFGKSFLGKRQNISVIAIVNVPLVVNFHLYTEA